MSAYDSNNIFAKILRGEIPNHTVYEDEKVLALLDVMPGAWPCVDCAENAGRGAERSAVRIRASCVCHRQNHCRPAQSFTAAWHRTNAQRG